MVRLRLVSKGSREKGPFILKFPSIFIRLFFTIFYSFLAFPSDAALLAPTASFVGSSGDNLSSSSSPGFPGLNWFIELDWEQTAPVMIEVPVLPGGSESPDLHTVFLDAGNLTERTWKGFEVDIDGPAGTSFIPTPNLAGLFPAILVPSGTEGFAFEGLAWTPSPILPVFINFGLDVVPPAAGETVRLTFTPIPVPEPGTGALIVTGLLLSLRRRSVTMA